jgi:hypothetical protein
MTVRDTGHLAAKAACAEVDQLDGLCNMHLVLQKSIVVGGMFPVHGVVRPKVRDRMHACSGAAAVTLVVQGDSGPLPQASTPTVGGPDDLAPTLGFLGNSDAFRNNGIMSSRYVFTVSELYQSHSHSPTLQVYLLHIGM